MTQEPTRARFPDFAPGRGGYESFYVKVAAPDRSRALWIRYTVNQRPHESPRGSLWFTWFDPVDGAPVASKVTPDAPPGVAAGEFLHVGGGSFGPGFLRGAAPADGLDVSWDLSYRGPAEPLWHLPRPWMYTAPLPRTKLLSPLPRAAMSGTVRVNDRSVELDGWPGMVGHNWGTEHAERWIWLQGALFDGRGPDTWLDVALGRLKLGRFTTPWVANGVLSVDGRRHRIGGLGRARSTRVVETPEGCDFRLPGPGLTLRGRVSARRQDLVGWVYADPDGSEHHTVNCSVSDLTLEVELEGTPSLRLRAPGSATYELGMRERDHGVPIQPFPDQ
jgi:hypothetical protein